MKAGLLKKCNVPWLGSFSFFMATMATMATLVLASLASCGGRGESSGPPENRLKSAQGVAAVVRSLAPHYSTYAEVRPIAPLRVSTLLDGTLKEFNVFPGMRVVRGQVLGRLAGVEHQKEVAAARSALAEVRVAFKLAGEEECAVRRTYPAISDRRQLRAAMAAVAKAREQLKAVRARWAFIVKNGVIRAPVAGVVTAVFAVSEQKVVAGTALLRMQNPRRLWLYGVYYGPAARRLRPGMKGTFIPGRGRPPIAVRVRGVIPPIRPDGGRGVGCAPVAPASWLNGEAGTLRLEGPSVSRLMVPSTALILKGGKWYVVLHETKGDTRREVVPGPRSAGWTVIRKGLRPGQIVVVRDAYLIFHKNVAQFYTPPD